MAQNQTFDGKRLTVTAAGVTSGAPVVVGKLVGVAVGATNAATGKVVIDTEGVHELSVKGINAGGNIAINCGDELFHTAADTPPISAKATGVLIGYAYSESVAAGAQLIASGATGTIQVVLAKK